MYQLTGPLNYCRPSLVSGPNQSSPYTGSAYPIPGNVFHAGDFLQLFTQGTLTYVNPQGSLIGFQPTQAPTVAYTVSGTAGKAILYGFYTYQGTGVESLPSPWFTIVVPAGQVATITVPTTNAPAAATGFNLYMGFAPYTAWQQVAATALGSPATVPNPLTNYQGAGLAQTNAAGSILGLAQDDWDVLYQSGPAQAYTRNDLLFGADVTNIDPEQYKVKFSKLTNAQRFVISTVQPWNQGLVNQTGGLNYISAQNLFAWDSTQTNRLMTIVDSDDNLDNWPASQPFVTGIVGAQAVAIFNSGVLQ